MGIRGVYRSIKLSRAEILSYKILWEYGLIYPNPHFIIQHDDYTIRMDQNNQSMQKIEAPFENFTYGT